MPSVILFLVFVATSGVARLDLISLNKEVKNGEFVVFTRVNEANQRFF